MKKIFKFIGKGFKAIGLFFKKLFVGIVKYIVNVFRQMKKMRWPSKKTILETTTIVLVFVFLLSVYFIIDDFIIIQLLKLIKY